MIKVKYDKYLRIEGVLILQKLQINVVMNWPLADSRIHRPNFSFLHGEHISTQRIPKSTKCLIAYHHDLCCPPSMVVWHLHIYSNHTLYCTQLVNDTKHWWFLPSTGKRIYEIVIQLLVRDDSELGIAHSCQRTGTGISANKTWAGSNDARPRATPRFRYTRNSPVPWRRTQALYEDVATGPTLPRTGPSPAVRLNKLKLDVHNVWQGKN
jgi:hypothetical protein